MECPANSVNDDCTGVDADLNDTRELDEECGREILSFVFFLKEVQVSK